MAGVIILGSEGRVFDIESRICRLCCCGGEAGGEAIGAIAVLNCRKLVENISILQHGDLLLSCDSSHRCSKDISEFLPGRHTSPTKNLDKVRQYNMSQKNNIEAL